MKEEIKFFLKWWIIISFISIIFVILIFYVFVPAYNSVYFACFSNMTMEELNNSGLIGGVFHYDYSNQSECYIQINKEKGTIAFRKTLAHEKVHYLQFQAGILADCDSPIRLYINECEASFSELFVW